jgi:hypothetical protein
MIDWYFVVAHALWILGASIVLAAFGYHRWLAQETGARLRDTLACRSWDLTSAGGMVLVSLGVCLTQLEWWVRTTWAFVGLTFVWRVGALLRAGHTRPTSAGRGSKR